ncbi:GAF domain-containing protein [Candidatus Amarolinea dominans]|uniref:GAF domain-containing protein n=1 Tax=Candidatus Amarolinea dominans TaxID=3140696 RepID=UPI00313703AB|nr:GAF domain-containing protein [Anaerolineae bacterium]
MTPLPPTQSDDLAAEPPDPQAHSTSDAHQLLLELGELWAAPDNAHKARLAGLRRVQTFFGAEAICLALADPFSNRFDLTYRLGRCVWPAELWPRVMTGGNTQLPGGVLGLPAAVSGQAPNGVLALLRPGVMFSGREQRWLRRVGVLLAHEQNAHRLRLLMRIMEQANRKENPIDLYSFLLDELQRFIKYDHSAAVIVLDRENNRLIVRRELVQPAVEAWRLPSPRAINLESGLAQRLAGMHSAPVRPIEYQRASAGDPWQGETASWLAQALAYGELPWRPEGKDHPAEAQTPVAPVAPCSPEGGILAVPLVHNDTVWGLLKLSTLRCGPLRLPTADAQVVQQFADRLALTLYQSDLYYRRQLEMDAVREIGQTTTHPVSLETVCQTTLEAALKTLHLTVGQVQTRLRLVHEQPVQAGSTHARETVTQALADLERGVWSSGVAGLHNNLPPPAAAPAGSRVMRAALIVPIQYEHAVIGLISVQSSLAERFRPTDQTFLQTVAHEAALALKTAELYEQVRQQAEERKERLALLHELSRSLNRELDLQTVLHHAVVTSRARLRAETASIFLLKDGVLRRQDSDGQDDGLFPDEIYRVGEGLTGLASCAQPPVHPDHCPCHAQGGQPPAASRDPRDLTAEANQERGTRFGQAVACNQVNDCPLVIEAHRRRYRDILRSGQAQHLIAVPLDDAYHTFGVLRVLNKLTPEGALDQAGFSDDDRDLLSTIASQVATAISNLRQTQRLTSIFEVNELLSRTPDRQQIGDRIAQIMTGPALSYSDCTLHLLEGDRLILIPRTGEPASGAALEIGLHEGVMGWVAREKRHRYVLDIAQDPDFKHKDWASQQGLVSMLCVPLLTGDRVFGTLAVYTTYEHEFNDDEVRGLHTFATQAAIAFASAQRQQQLLRANEVRTAELHKATHELRSPLAQAKNITGNLLAGKLGALTKKQHDRLEKLTGYLERQQRQIDKLLLLSRLEAGGDHPGISFDPKQLNVRTLLRQAQRRAADPAQRKKLHLDIKRFANASLAVWGDQYTLEQVLDNLIENAIKFTPAGGAITLGYDTWKDRIRITISDSGIGISEEMRTRVFEKYFQITNTSQDQTTGLGLGLAICQEIVQRHGGEIEIHDTPGGGATFMIFLPGN